MSVSTPIPKLPNIGFATKGYFKFLTILFKLSLFLIVIPTNLGTGMLFLSKIIDVFNLFFEIFTDSVSLKLLL